MKIELNLTELTEAEVEKVIQTGHETDLSNDEAREESLRSHLAIRAAEALKIKEKLKGSEVKLGVLRNRLEKRLKAYQKTEKDLQTLTVKTRLLEDEEIVSITDVRRYQKDISLVEGSIANNKELLELSSPAAKSLLMVSELIQPGTTVEVRTDLDAGGHLVVMEWSTRDVFIKDEDGQPLPMNFGSFKVKAHVNDSRCLGVYMLSDKPQLRESYSHPHITAEGNPCLGNASAMILQSLLANNYGMVIKAVDKFLTHYNKRDPYKQLSHWIPSLYHTPMCECGLRMISDCSCERCSGCFTLVTDKQEDDLYPFRVAGRSVHGCGSCSVCCSGSHFQVTENGLQETGINKSACYSLSIRKPLEAS